MRNAAERVLRKLCKKCRKIITAERQKQQTARRTGIKEQRDANARARTMYLNGATPEEVADMFEVSVDRAKRMVLPGGQQGWRRNRSSLDLEQMQSLFAAGHTAAEVAQMTNCPVSVAKKWQRRQGELSGADV